MTKHFLKRSLALTLTLAMMPLSSFAQQTVTVSYPAIYPFVPMDTQKIYDSVTTVSEDTRFERNFLEMNNRGLSRGQSKHQPWTSSYWPLSKGQIADPYEDSSLAYNLDIGWVAWKDNYKSLTKRREEDLPKVYSFDQEDLDKLAPSEKYDLLMGDMSFDLTKRVVQYMYDWGSKKENAFITKVWNTGEGSLDLAHQYVENNSYNSIEDAFKNNDVLKNTLTAQYSLDLVRRKKYKSVEDAFSEALSMAQRADDNYVLEKKNSRMAAWEGICNGWSVAAGLVPRPRKIVSFDLPNGKKLNFYPEDIKGLVSLYYFNSLIQDPVPQGNIDFETKLPMVQGVVSAGLRCNLKRAKEDLWGRKYDHEPDPFYKKHEARCSGVHPAIWHLGIVNLIGKQKRNIIVERKVGAAVDNHPFYKYEFKFFNPNTGRGEYDPLDPESDDSFADVVVRADDEDQFKQFRHPKTKFIVGVEADMFYMNYRRPKRQELDSEEDDKVVEKEMYYDLELDANYNIIGGQWRAKKVGYAQERESGLKHTQPDFFWTVTKNYNKDEWTKGWFENEKGVEPWKDKTKLPPKSWLQNAQSYHSFNYLNKVEWNNAVSCRVKNKKTKKYKDVYCDMSTNRPQPYINVVNTLVELSK
ncbi:MAG: hypothetical protein CME62_06900 [Halobacteriovoraceae bacterium]|nr:hypothetical protein [Halobacteriovoraceae bacterium]